MTAKLKTTEISVYGVKMTAEFYHTPGKNIGVTEKAYTKAGLQ